MEETEDKHDIELNKKEQFTKMMLGVGAGFIAKELIESAFMFFVRRSRNKADATE